MLFSMYESYLYHPEKGFKTSLSVEEMGAAIKDDSSTLWLDVSEIDDTDIDVLTNIFNMHPLTVEDFIMPNARPKAEEFPNYLFLVIFSIHSDNGNQQGKICTTEIDYCLGKNFLITFHPEPCPSINVSKERVKKQSPMIMHGADMLLNSILDSCVDSYFPVLSEIDSTVDAMSDELFNTPDQGVLKKIYYLKNNILNLRRSISPQADVMSLITRGTFRFITPQNLIYFRNVYDNMVRFNDAIGALRDVISGAMEAYASIISNRLNEVMKTLTVITTIMMPLTLVASFYGMNFKHMPELDNKFAYPTVIIVMIIITIFMLAFFKRKKWI